MGVSLVDTSSSKHTAMGQAAAQYQALGLSVIPWAVRPDDKGGSRKVPQRSYDTQLVAPMSAAEVIRWWQMNPDHNVGVITGPTGTQHTGRHPLVRPTDLVGLDLDTPKALAWADLYLPDTPWVVRSGRASGLGEHRVYRYPTNLPPGRWISSRAGLLGISGLDIRGFNGYVAMPPSIHASGAPYTWVSRPDSVLELPLFDLAWFDGCDLLNRLGEEPAHNEGLASDEAVAIAAEWLAKQEPAIENRVVAGSNGERQTFRICAKLRRGFGLAVSQALLLLEPWNARCQPPWDEDGLVRKLNDAYDGGDEPLGGAFREAKNAKAVQVLLNRAPQPRRPAYTEPPSRDTLADALAVCMEMPGRVVDDVGFPYTEAATAAALLVRRKDMPAFIRLKEELKSVKVAVKDWEKHLDATQRKLAAVKKLELEHEDIGLYPVMLTNDERHLVAEVLKGLAQAPAIFLYGQTLVNIRGTNVTPLHKDITRNAILLTCKPERKIVDRLGNDTQSSPQFPLNLPGLIDNALPEQLHGFRRVRNILRVPFCAPADDGMNHRLVTVPTYDQGTQTILSETPEIRMDNYPTAVDAMSYLRWIFSDFPFESETDWCNYLGAMLQIVVRPSINGPTPLHVIEASQERGGKTLLAKVLLILAGVDPPVMSTLRNKSEMIPQDIFAAVRDGRPVQFWDNVIDVVDSPDMASLLTSTMFSGRILRTSSTQTVPCEQLWGITSNNALLSAELAKRSVRMRLLTTPTTTQKVYKIPDLLSYTRQHRGDILSALCRLIQHWVDARSPKAPPTVWLEGYEAWVRIIGGICHSVGATSWLNNRHETVRHLAAHSEWEPFCHAWWDAYNVKPVSTRDLLRLADKNQLLSAVRGEGSDLSQLTKLGMSLRKQHQAYHADYQILTVDQRAHGAMYKLVQTNVVPLTKQAAAR